MTQFTVLPLKFVPNDNSIIWPEDADKRGLIADSMEIAVLDKGMTSGAPSIMIKFNLPDGQSVVVCETSVKLLITMGIAIQARYPGVMDDDFTERKPQ